MPTLSEQVAERLVKTIHEKGYAPGDKLPTEAELQKICNVGRNTIREALKLLTSRNIVEIRQGAGTFIAQKPGIIEDPLGFNMINDCKKLVQDLQQIRLIIEPPIAGLAAEYAKETDIRELEQILLKMECAMSRLESYTKLDAAFHKKIAECTQNTVIENLIPIIGNGIAIFASEVENTEYNITKRSHRLIFEYISKHQPFEAEMEMRFHLTFNTKCYMEKMS